MRFIHTADWHLGSNFHNIDRHEEAKAFLSWLKDTIDEYKAQALIVSGDIFDTPNPPVRARGLYFDFLAALPLTSCRNVIVTGGNHDSGALLDAPKEVLRAINVHTVGSMTGRRAADCVVPMRDARGTLIGICAAIPYMREAELRQYDTQDEATPGFMERTLRCVYSEAAQAATEMMNGARVPFIVTGHLFATGLEGRYSAQKDGSADDGGRAIDVMGNLGNVDADVFPASADYAALGHIHYTTMVGGNPKVRYSGSPFCLGFDETHIERNVLLVDIDGGALEVKKIKVPQTYRFARFTGTVQEIKQQIAEIVSEPISMTETSDSPSSQEHGSIGSSAALTNHSTRQPMFVEIVHDRRDGLDARTALDEVLRDAPFTVVSWKTKKPQMSSGVYVETEGAEAASELSEEDVFKRLIEQKAQEEGIEAGSGLMNDVLKEYLPMFMQMSAQAEQAEQAGDL